MQENISLFFSSAPEDRNFCQEFITQLSVLQRHAYIQLHFDQAILAGYPLQKEVERWLASADLIFFLVSPDLLAPEEFHRFTLARAMQHYRSSAARIISIILRPCDWKNTPLQALPVLPKDGQAVTQHSDRDLIFAEIVREIRQEIKNCLLRRFQVALKRGEPQQITSAFVPDFIARHELSPHKQRILSLAEQFTQAYTSEDDAALARISQEILTNAPNAFKFSESEQQRLDLALKRHTAYQKLSDLLRSRKHPVDLLNAYQSYLASGSKRTLTRDDLAQIDLAQRYITASTTHDYKKLSAIYNQTLTPPYDQLFQFTRRDLEEILHLTHAPVPSPASQSSIVHEVSILADSETGLTPALAQSLDIRLIQSPSSTKKPDRPLTQRQTGSRQAPFITQTLREGYIQAIHSGSIGILSLHPSSRLSPTYQAARNAWATLPAAQKKDISIEIVDTQNIAPAVALALESALAEVGRAARLQEIKASVLTHLSRTFILTTAERWANDQIQDRSQTTPSLLESIWDVKPIFTLKEGKPTLVEECSTLQKAHERMLQMLRERGNLARVALSSSDEELARRLSKSLRTFYAGPITLYQNTGALFSPDAVVMAALLKT